jgi:MoxR-like ATPase
MNEERPSSGSPPPPAASRSRGSQLAALLQAVHYEIKKVVVGQDHAIERILVCLLVEGHVLIEGLPGLAKTLTVETLAHVVGGSFTRIQFTPDLVPSDIVGTRIYRASTEHFDVELGPVFANFVLTDEINRAPAKVQAALLEVMAERHVSIGGQRFAAPRPFQVLATQNPIESEGVYPLPEAQRDRFLMKLVVSYPSYGEELEITRRMGRGVPSTDTVLALEDLVRLQRIVPDIYVDPAVADYAVRLVMATRHPQQFGVPDVAPYLICGASPRATLGLLAAARGMAILRGRAFVLPEDVAALAPDVLRHRLLLTYEALANGVDTDAVVARILAETPPARQPSAPGETAPPDEARPPTAIPQRRRGRSA